MEEAPKITIPAKKRLLFCIDGDGTLIPLIRLPDGTIVTTHDIIWMAIREDPSIEHTPEAQWNLVKHLLPIGGAEMWKKVLRKMVDDGHATSFVSFSSFGKHILPRYLAENVGLEKSFIEENIVVVSFLPPLKKNRNDKRAHIQETKVILHLEDIEDNDVALIDDSGKNIAAAEKDKHYTILATPDGEHLHAMMRLLTFIADQENKNTGDENLFCSGGSSSSKDVEHLLVYSSKSPSPIIGRGPTTPVNERNILKSSGENLKFSK